MTTTIENGYPGYGWQQAQKLGINDYLWFVYSTYLMHRDRHGQSVPIIPEVVSLNPVQARCTRYNIW